MFKSPKTCVITCSALFLLLSLTIFSGCHPAVKVKAYQPAEVNMGNAKVLKLVHVAGRWDIKDMVISELQRQARRSGWWYFENAMQRGIDIRVAGYKAYAAPYMPKEGEVFLKVDLYELKVFQDIEEREEKTKDGKKQYRKRKVFKANASLGFTTIDKDGISDLLETDLSSRVKLYKDEGGSRDKASQAAIADVVAQFYELITPKQVVSHLRLDEDASDMESIVKIINKGSYAAAERQLREKMKREPNRADIVYNLAVITDAMGRPKEAMAYYEKAIHLGPKDFYYSSRDNCAQRIEAARTLNR
jgi:tetratricopeptide (TPR) repeat protein